MIRKLILAAAAIPVSACLLLAGAGAAHAAHPDLLPVKSGVPMRVTAYDWALTQHGCWYVWGGTGPCGSGYDCSGLVMMAYRHAGVYLPRTTYGMLGSSLLVRVRVPREGDLAFYGSGHVELFRKWGYTYGAHDSGTVVSLVRYSRFWKPTAYYRVRTPARR